MTLPMSWYMTYIVQCTGDGLWVLQRDEWRVRLTKLLFILWLAICMTIKEKKNLQTYCDISGQTDINRQHMPALSCGFVRERWKLHEQSPCILKVCLICPYILSVHPIFIPHSKKLNGDECLLLWWMALFVRGQLNSPQYHMSERKKRYDIGDMSGSTLFPFPI